VASRAFIEPIPQKATLADFPNPGNGSGSADHWHHIAAEIVRRGM